MDRFETLEKMLEIVEAMKCNICKMMEDEVKSRLILAKASWRGDERKEPTTDIG